MSVIEDNYYEGKEDYFYGDPEDYKIDYKILGNKYVLHVK